MKRLLLFTVLVVVSSNAITAQTTLNQDGEIMDYLSGLSPVSLSGVDAETPRHLIEGETGTLDINSLESGAESLFQEVSALQYTPNHGQVVDVLGNPRPDILYVVESPGMKVYFRETGLSYVYEEMEYPEGYDPVASLESDPLDDPELEPEVTVRMHRVDIDFDGAQTPSAIEQEGELESHTNYYLPHCPDGITQVHGYEQVTYKDIYPGIDWILYLDEGQLRYDLRVHPGADPQQIRMKIDGTEDYRITAEGTLEIATPMGTITEHAPEVYQGTEQIASRYLLERDILTFDLEDYNPAMALLIDPTRDWGTYYGGSVDDFGGGGCAVDDNGDVFIYGRTQSADFPVSTGVFQNTYAENSDAYLVKFDGNGNRQWATYYGGSGGDYGGGGCAVDNNGDVFIHGRTQSTDFPVSTGAHQVTHEGNSDAYLVKFDGTGARLWGTYYGGSGSELGRGGCAVDESGNVFIHGYTFSTDFPVSTGAFQESHAGNADAYLVKFDGSGNRQWATYFGGASDDYGEGGCAVDGNGNVFIHGRTFSQDFPVSTGAFQESHANEGSFFSSYDAYLVKFDGTGERLWGTYYGGSSSELGQGGCAVDGDGNVFIHGATQSTDFPVSTGAFQESHAGSNDAYLVKFDGNGLRLWGTYYGGSSGDYGRGGCAVDGNGDVFIHGYTWSTDFPISAGAFQENHAGGSNDAYLVKFNGQGSRLWATYYGGSDKDEGTGGCVVDGNEGIFILGRTASANFPVSSGAFQENHAGGSYDAYLVKFVPCTDPPTASCQDITVQLDANGQATITPNDIDNGSAAHCGVDIMTLSQSNFDINDVGNSITVTLTVTDLNGATASCSAVVTVEDYDHSACLNDPPVTCAPSYTSGCNFIGQIHNFETTGGINNISNLKSGCSGTASSAADFTHMEVTVPSGGGSFDFIVNGGRTFYRLGYAIWIDFNQDGQFDSSEEQWNSSGTSTGSFSGTINVSASTLAGEYIMRVRSRYFGVPAAACGPEGYYGEAEDYTLVVECSGTGGECDPPIANCKNAVVQLDATGSASITEQDVDDGSVADCGIASITVSPSSFTCADVGSKQVTLIVTDNEGNQDQCTATVTVVDNIPPVATCQDITVQLDNTGNATITAVEVNNGSSDNCSIASMSVEPTSFTCAEMGINTATLTVTDAAGNIDNCTATVTITPPNIPITVTVDTVAPTSGNDTIVIYDNAPAALNLPAQANLMASGIPSSYTGISYQWYYRDLPGGLWNPIAGATGSTLLVTSNGDFIREYKVEIVSDSDCEASDAIVVESIDAGCGNNSNKVQVCYYPPGNSGNPQTVCVNYNALSAFLNANPNSYVGSCEVSSKKGGEIGTDEEAEAYDFWVEPNPFTGQTSITVVMPRDEDVTLTVTNSLGQVIALLHNGALPKGEHAFQLNGSHLPAGVYFFTLVGSDHRETGKMILVR